jgi:adenylate kinase
MRQAIILLGAPGAGKGTVAEDIKNTLGFMHVSTGDMLREAVTAGRPVGLEAKAYMDKGELVPDAVILRLVEQLLVGGPADGRYMFDGFPRTEAQADLLGDLLKRLNIALSHVFLLEVPRDVVMKRLTTRRVCRKCGAVYNTRTMPPKKEGVCDACGGEVYQRADDNEVTVANRLDVFQKQTSGLIQYYDNQKLLYRIDSTDRIETENEICRLMNVR